MLMADEGWDSDGSIDFEDANEIFEVSDDDEDEIEREARLHRQRKKGGIRDRYQASTQLEKILFPRLSLMNSSLAALPLPIFAIKQVRIVNLLQSECGYDVTEGWVEIPKSDTELVAIVRWLAQHHIVAIK